ncbi:hypothetical protein [Sphingomonas sp. C3-2]|uniref:hypothetical protein n=1 Tax=Sphingomonas sp. C3-2 TaxID=3062169 RepID=UPI00294B2A1A|nr:hypothetical protein [Sphingomonas sp. C3-2]WOK36560.1 hypothetical protein QYC26_16425 [Sphingomonas sp. C3-2]
MKKMVLAATMLAVATPAAATPLWQGVEAGMSGRDVMKLYPKAKKSKKQIDIKKYEPIAGCKGEVNIMLVKDAVTEVIVTGDDNKCASKLYVALMGKYGNPADASQSGKGGGARGYLDGQVNKGLGNLMDQAIPGGALASNLVDGLGLFGGDSKKEATWFQEGAMLRFALKGGDWSMTYSPMEDLGL